MKTQVQLKAIKVIVDVITNVVLRAPLFVSIFFLGGCISQNTQNSWGGGVSWPSATDLGTAAKKAATDPKTWVPVVAAGVLLATDLDEDWSEDLYEDQPIFGEDAQDRSDDLRDLATGVYLITALAAPSDSIQDKLKGLSVGAGTMLLDGVLSQGLKDVVGRDRPDASNDESFPSGHASKASSRTAMAIRNLEHMEINSGLRTTANVMLHGVALGTGLARVEAGKHHLSDVLAGYALGQFVAGFMHHAFMQEDSSVQISFTPYQDGGGLTVTLPLR